MSEPRLGADSTLDNDQYVLDPRYHSDEDGEVPQAWETADRIRALLRQDEYDERDRRDLGRAVRRQLRTAELYRLLRRTLEIMIHTRPQLTMYVLLFPGEARDNTGIKDLNDNVLGYTLNQQYTARRQEEIVRIFQPGFVVVGQDYKSGLFLGVDKDRAEYDRLLHELDKALRQILLDEFLPKSGKEGARKLRRVLEKDPEYRFDIYYGIDGLDLRSFPPPPGGEAHLLAAFLLLTQALKGAATARYIATSRELKAVRELGGRARPDRRFDVRGKQFAWVEFLRVAGLATEIKTRFVRPRAQDPYLQDYNPVYVDTVWTEAFLRHQRVGNRDVVRDTRKKKLVKAPWPNQTYTFPAQKEMLELWLVVLNLIDFVNDFVAEELPRQVLRQHEDAVRISDNLTELARPVDRQSVETFLTTDLRGVTLAVLGTASEFQFYAAAADYPARIIFMMDVRDLGVEVALMHDASVARILDGELADERLLRETIRSTEAVTRMRRLIHDRVVETFRRYHGLLQRHAAPRWTDGSREAARAFRKASGSLGDFSADVQIMLGGDEVMVAAHPRFAGYLHSIVADLAETMRAGVAFSLARTPDERREHQIAHHKAMRLADESHGLLKELERRKRRIERLIEMLARNPKKEKDIPKYRRRLDELPLGRVFTRIQHGNARALPMRRIEPLIAAMRAGKIPTGDRGIVELVDYDGNIVDYGQLTSDAEALEAAVRARVGRDNVRRDPPPMPRKKPPL